VTLVLLGLACLLVSQCAVWAYPRMVRAGAAEAATVQLIGVVALVGFVAFLLGAVLRRVTLRGR
jgi:hypothetical protein